MKKRYIVQSSNKKLYEEFNYIKDAMCCAEKEKEYEPIIIRVVYDDNVDDYLEDPNYEESVLWDSANSDVPLKDNKELYYISLEEEVEQENAKTRDKYVNAYINQCKLTNKDYDVNESISKDEYDISALDFMGIKYGCNYDRMKKYLKEYIKLNKGSK